MKKILITGADGMLAKSVKKIFEQDNNYEIIYLNREQLDITNVRNVIKVMENEKPNYVINCAAYTDVNKAEENELEAERINSEGIRILATVSELYFSKFIHISTDYVFDGSLDLNESYKEDDITNPINVYGKTKLQGEEQIRKHEYNYILRTSWLFGDGNNFVNKMIELGNKYAEINVVSDQYGSPTFTDDLAQVIKEIIEKEIPFGTYHVTNQGFTTWNKFAEKIFEYSGIECEVNPITSKEFERNSENKVKRPKNSKLDTSKILSQGIKIPDWEDALKRYLKLLLL